MKEDMIKGFEYNENEQFKINHEDLASIERIFEFVLRNAKTLKDLDFSSMVLIGCLEKVIREKIYSIYPEFGDIPDLDMPHFESVGFSDLSMLKFLMGIKGE